MKSSDWKKKFQEALKGTEIHADHKRTQKGLSELKIGPILCLNLTKNLLYLFLNLKFYKTKNRNPGTLPHNCLHPPPPLSYLSRLDVL